MVVKLNKKHKKEYFENLDVATNSKPFRNKCKPYFSYKHTKGDYNIMLIEKDEILLKNKNDVFNSYFDSVTDSLDLFFCSTETDNENTDALQNILKRFHNHPSLMKIKQLVNNQAKFSFQQVSAHTAKQVIEGLPSNKATAGEIPIKFLKESGFSFEYLTSCVNEAISSGKFPDSLKLSNTWMFCRKGLYLKIQKIYNKTLKVIYQSNKTYEELHELSETVSIQQRHL